MRSVLFIAIAYGQALMAVSQEPIYEGVNFNHASYPESYIKPELRKEKGVPKWVGKACTVAAVSAATFTVLTLQASLGSPTAPYTPFVAAGVAGAATYAYFELTDDSE
ncbi:MAG TPA: hypothetical protein VJK48_02350 [Chlamydiales bacterium]|nr:hypothetical protein [Chlamydiales bacterium]